MKGRHKSNFVGKPLKNTAGANSVNVLCKACSMGKRRAKFPRD